MPSTRERFAQYWRETNDAYRAMKEAEGALPQLYQAYEALSDSDRPLVDELVADTLDTDDQGLRFDALALIRRFHIGNAMPQLKRLAQRLSQTGPEQFERRKVLRIIDELDTPT